MSERLSLGTDATSHCRPVFAVRTEQHVVFVNPRSREAISGMIVVVVISSVLIGVVAWRRCGGVISLSLSVSLSRKPAVLDTDDDDGSYGGGCSLFV
jgi:hypothetical protein